MSLLFNILSRCINYYCWGEFVISSVLSCHSKNLKWWTDRCYSSVLFGKQRKIHPQGMRAGRPKRSWEEWRGEAWGSILAPLFSFFLLPLSLPYVNWVSHEGCLFHLRFSLWCLDLSLFSFHGLFSSLSFSLTFPNYLTFPPQKLGGIILWEYGHPGLSGYCFLLS